MRKETLFAFYVHHFWALKDLSGFLIGRFNELDELKEWCRVNGYSVRIQK